MQNWKRRVAESREKYEKEAHGRQQDDEDNDEEVEEDEYTVSERLDAYVHSAPRGKPQFRWKDAAARKKAHDMCNRLAEAGSWMNWKFSGIAIDECNNRVESLDLHFSAKVVELNMADERVVSLLQELQKADKVSFAPLGMLKMTIMVQLKGVLRKA